MESFHDPPAPLAPPVILREEAFSAATTDSEKFAARLRGESVDELITVINSHSGQSTSKVTASSLREAIDHETDDPLLEVSTTLGEVMTQILKNPAVMQAVGESAATALADAAKMVNSAVELRANAHAVGFDLKPGDTDPAFEGFSMPTGKIHEQDSQHFAASLR